MRAPAEAKMLAFSDTGDFGAQLQDMQDWTAMVLEMVRTLGSTLDLDDVLRMVSRKIVAVTGTQACGFCIVDEETNLHLTSWWEPGVLAYPSWKLAQILNEPEWCRTTGGILRALNRNTCMVVHDKQPAPAGGLNVARYLGFKSGLYVPCMQGEQVRAVAAAVTFDDHRLFSDRQIELVQRVASVAGAAIASSLLHQQSKQLAIAEERGRLAKEIHDSLAQTLGYLGLRLSLVDQLLAENDIGAARAYIDEMRQLTRDSYTDAQEAISNLRTSSDPSSRLLPILRRCVTEYRMRYNIEIQLHVDEASVLPAYAPEVETQIVRIVQEALTNVRKHAGTRLAWIHVRQDGGWLRITIQDDGCGFDPGQPGADGRAHYGLQIMRERAAGVGGSVEVRSHPGVGTRVQVRLPCEPDIARAL
jgi:signal transduction histidine kinase